MNTPTLFPTNKQRPQLSVEDAFSLTFNDVKRYRHPISAYIKVDEVDDFDPRKFNSAGAETWRQFGRAVAMLPYFSLHVQPSGWYWLTSNLEDKHVRVKDLDSNLVERLDEEGHWMYHPISRWLGLTVVDGQWLSWGYNRPWPVRRALKQGGWTCEWEAGVYYWYKPADEEVNPEVVRLTNERNATPYPTKYHFLASMRDQLRPHIQDDVPALVRGTAFLDGFRAELALLAGHAWADLPDRSDLIRRAEARAAQIKAQNKNA